MSEAGAPAPSDRPDRDDHPADRVEASSGWGVLHLFYAVDRERAEADPASAREVVDAIDAFADDEHQVLTFTVLGHKADFGVMAIGPDLSRLQTLQQALTRAPVRLAWSYVSLTEASEYTTTEDDERVRLAAEDGITDAAEVETRLNAWRDRMAHYRENRVHPRLPAKRTICFYPMSKRRDGADNWYALPFAERKRLMGGHARVGRTYAGRVLQLISGSTGIDDWEWGVT
ncbi:MAG: chlorite dismutase family protein, partial [Actinomycetota bacterium]